MYRSQSLVDEIRFQRVCIQNTSMQGLPMKVSLILSGIIPC